MKRSYLYAGAAILMWSTMSTVSKLLLAEMDSYKVLCSGMLLATVAMLVINLCSKKWKLMKSYRFTDYLKMALIGLPGITVYYALYYMGAERLPASQAFIINYLWPIMSILFACLILKEKMTVRKILAVVLSFLGVFTVAGKDLIRFNASSVVGMVFCFGAAVFYGLYTALNKKSSYDKQVSMTVACFTAFLFSLVIVLIRGENLLISWVQVPGMVWNGVFTIALANLVWALALQGGNTAKVSNLAYITPFLSLVWTRLVLKEPIDPISVLGLCLIVVGIFIQLKDGKRKAIKQEESL